MQSHMDLISMCTKKRFICHETESGWLNERARERKKEPSVWNVMKSMACISEITAWNFHNQKSNIYLYKIQRTHTHTHTREEKNMLHLYGDSKNSNIQISSKKKATQKKPNLKKLLFNYGRFAFLFYCLAYTRRRKNKRAEKTNRKKFNRYQINAPKL